MSWVLGCLAGTAYLLPPLGALLYGRPRPNLRDWEPLPQEQAPPVSVILPVRNEEANLERCVRSILASDYHEFEIVVVNDGSEDRTAAILSRLAMEDDRVMPVQGKPLPKGWFGKPWACWQGYEAAQGELLLFTDADTVHGPHLLSHAVAALERQRSDMLTVMPVQEMRSFWERVIQPFFILLLGLRFGSPERLNRNRDPRRAIANGQFILTTRDAYQWVGGHRKVQHTVIEDMLLARAYVTAGKHVLFALADQDMRTRMYTSLREAVDGWTKNIFIGMLESLGSKALAYGAVMGSLLLPLVFLLPTAAIVTGLVLNLPAVLAFGLTGFLGCSFLIGHILRMAKELDLWGVYHPLGAVMFAFILLRAAARGTRRIEWKGRTYRAS